MEVTVKFAATGGVKGGTIEFFVQLNTKTHEHIRENKNIFFMFLPIMCLVK
jgi:hypothetical protein